MTESPPPASAEPLHTPGPTRVQEPRPPARPGKAAFIVGWLLSAIPIVMLGVGGVAMLFNPDMVNEGMAEHGFAPGLGMKIIYIEIACVLLFVIPQTAVLGAVLITAYLGGAVAIHVRTGDGMWFLPILFAIPAWLGLLLRDPRLRTLLPLRILPRHGG